MGSLAFYGSENGKKSGWAKDYYRARDSKEAETDPFAIHLGDQPDLKALYHDAEHVGELRCPFPLPGLRSNRCSADPGGFVTAILTPQTTTTAT